MAVQELQVRIQTLSPVVLTAAHDSQVMTETQQQIPGSILRGVLATHYIEQQHLGRNAHRNPAFRQLFFEKLRFLPAMPVQNGEQAFQLPLSLLKEKETAEIYDGLSDAPKPGKDKAFKSFRGMAVATDGLSPVSVPTSISLHMTRSNADQRLQGSSQDGGIFNYESINAGQVFAGSIIGDSKDLEALKQGLLLEDTGFLCHIGRSKFTEYGDCRLVLLAETAIPHLPQKEDLTQQALTLRFASDYLPEQITAPDNIADARQTLTTAFQQALGKDFHVGKVFSRAMSSGNFVGIWCMQQPRVTGLAAGTAFELCKDSAWTNEDLEKVTELAVNGIGARTVEGFGQIRFWQVKTQSLAMAERDKAAEQESLPQELLPLPASIRQQVKHILLNRIKEQLRIYAYEDVQGLRLPRGCQHFFSELAEMLRSAHETAGSTRQNLEKALADKVKYRDTFERDKQDKAQSPFQEKLTKIYFADGRTLRDCFTGTDLPYDISSSRSWMKDISLNSGALENLLKDADLSIADFHISDGDCYFEYWRWFCRFARKRARQVGRN